LTGITVTQTGQNAGSISGPTSTIFATTNAGVALTITLVQSTAPSCGTSALWSTSTPTANVYITGTAACTTNSNDWFEELTWTGVGSTGFGQSDTFFIATTYTGGTGSSAATFGVADHTSPDAGFTGTLNVYLDAGTSAAGGLPNAYTAVDIAVSGT
jgi:hypothetical protein